MLVTLAVLPLAALLVDVFPSGPAAADTIGGTQGRASQLASQIAGEATQIHQLDQRYASAEDQVVVVDQQLRSARLAVVASQRQMARARADLSRQAVAAYMQAGTPSELIGLLSQQPTTYAVSQVYLGVAAGATTSALDGFRLARRGMDAREVALEAAQHQAAAAATTILALRSGLQSQLGQEAATLAQVKGHLAQLVAQAQAAQAARAAAAQAAVRRQVAAQAAAAVAVSTAGQQTPAQQQAPAQAAVQTGAVVSASLPQGLPLPAGIQTLAQPPSTPVPVGGSAAFAALRQCESGGNYGADTGNGYYGAYQFSAGTWHNLGYPGLPSQASPAQQDQAAARLQAQSGWGQWPTCSATLGLG